MYFQSKTKNKHHHWNLKILWAKFLSKSDGDRNCFDNFQTDKKLEQHQKSYRDYDDAELEIPRKFKTIWNKETNEIEDVAGTILNHSLQNESLQPPFITVYDFETM